MMNAFWILFQQSLAALQVYKDEFIFYLMYSPLGIDFCV